MTDPIPRLNAALEGRYRIERELGEGGMATVYLAQDLKHERRVALKVLKPELAAVVGADRFLAEIKTTANLQHPHILPLYDSGEADSLLFYVMPYVEGESLRERLEREHQLPVDDAVRIATNMAEALDYAHRQGVIHRDIKPANVMLQDGKPVIADFGIALAVSAGGRLTETGLSLGTPHYMSPEQATGDQAVGPATDIYALGCVLYEMLVGEPPYTGSTPQAILGKIIQAEPVSATKTRRTVPVNVDAVIRRALEKVPADRFLSASAFTAALQDPHFQFGKGLGPVRGASTAHARSTVGVLSAALVVAAGLALWGWIRPTGSPPARRATELQLPQLSRLRARGAALAPNGDAIVLSAEGRLWLRNLDESAGFHEIPGTEGGFGPFWSPSGDWIGFFRSTDLAKIRREGGSPVSVLQIDLCCSVDSDGQWLNDGRILISTGWSDLYVVGEDGGPAEVLLAAAEAEHFHRPLLLPGGEIVVEVDPDFAPNRVDLWEGDTSRQVGWSFPNYSESGHVLYQRDNSIWATPYSSRRGPSNGDAFLVLQNAIPLSAARDGSLLAWRAGDRERSLVWVFRTGLTDAPLAGFDDPVGGIPAVSPDGVLAYRSGRQIWLLDPSRGGPRPVTDPVASDSPVWSVDGQRIYYQVREPGSEVGEGRIDVLDVASGRSQSVVEGGFWPSESPDGRYLVYGVKVGTLGNELRVLDLSSPGADPVPFGTGPPIRSQAVVSPIGGLVAYRAGEAAWALAGPELWISRFPSGDEPLRVSTDVASPPRWSPDGSWLYFVRGADGALMEVHVSAGDGPLAVSAATELFDEVGSGLALTMGFELSASGDRFLGIREVTPRGGMREELILLQNWLGNTVGSRE